MTIEAMKQALEFVEQNTYGGDDAANLITALRAAIEQAEKHEPVAWMHPDWPDGYSGFQSPVTTYMTNGWIPLYTTPPAAQRQWVGLMQGVRVVDDSVIVVTKNNDTARQLCAELLREKNAA